MTERFPFMQAYRAQDALSVAQGEFLTGEENGQIQAIREALSARIHAAEKEQDERLGARRSER